MTTLTVPARPMQHAMPRQVPWRRMIWITWRQHWIAIAAGAVFLGAVAGYVWAAGLRLHHAYAAATSCNAASPVCDDLINRINFMNHLLVGGYTLQILPAVLGAFLGAPVLARELETGTFRYAWTQGFGRWRWTLAKLVVLGVVVTAAAGAMSVLFSWYYRPYVDTSNPALLPYARSPFSAGLFDLRGVSFAAWTLAAFAIGGLAGMAIRRVVPAIVATLTVYTGLGFAAAELLRQHYMSPATTTAVNVPTSAWVISQHWIRNGKFAFAGLGNAPHRLIQACTPTPVGTFRKDFPGSLAQCFAHHGYRQLTSYQPPGRFWAFQWIESGWLLALSALLVAVTIWLVRHRAA